MKKIFLGMMATVAITMSGAAFAHAHLKSAFPAINGVAVNSPSNLVLKFSEGLNIHFTGVKLVNANHQPIKTGNALLSGSDDKAMVVPLPDMLAKGKYTVDWHALSKDGHKTKGHYTFVIKK
ncbi:Copper resistance protein C precursor [Marinomonas spartinae]|uniref:copper homeostasis periplasmic binding protein CopC n=1 Tax=Marinomonas spartinae TaxID=1792290 RepID=UPI000808F3B6|nr:copper homeostasis periplasmic binding protein CopC [Marinomonas spartinae]SBS37729.1 Copper resistance protein C precursor [Marinomonas spartinae]